MVSYGAIPLSGLSSQDIAERALTRQLTHGMYVNRQFSRPIYICIIAVTSIIYYDIVIYTMEPLF